jgi:apolipoprotein N-acyltransferase
VLLRILVAVACGVGLSLAFEPVAVPLVIPFAVAGFVLTVRELRPGRALLVGLAFGVGFQFVLLYWMRAVGTDAWLGLSIWQSLFFAVLGLVANLLQRHRLWPLWVAAAWVTTELWFSGWPFSGMPWGRLAFAVADTPLADALPWIGTVGASLVLALSGTLLAWAFVEHGRVRLVALGSLAALAAAALLLPWP